ncbi:tyrosine-type recombinase/integrase [Pseudooceanicola sp.]|uniref:tyrosine-type recombinase/integrase n=1 Tax=Pseudooceanicola sp. TaxID=1914328 RepID=UPI0035C749FC
MTDIIELKDNYPELARRIASCRFQDRSIVAELPFRESAYFERLLEGRHIGIYRPHERVCTWTARYLTADKRYLQRSLGPALVGKDHQASFEKAIASALDWFQSTDVMTHASRPRRRHRTTSVSICPIGKVYSVGHALRDYTEWTKLARTPGGHYNTLSAINHHLVPNLAHIPLEEFNAKHLRSLAAKVLEEPPRHGFSHYREPVRPEELSADDLRKRKRTFNSLVTILKMAFRQAWENGEIETERPWRCLNRVPVIHSPRRIFLNRTECQRLLENCTPALRRLVLAALYSGCRIGELANLRVQDVGFQGYGIRVSEFKRSPARFVFLPDEGMAFFLDCCRDKAPRDRVLLSDREKVWRRQHTPLFRRAVTRAKLPPGFVFHGLRHTYASELVRKGVSLEVVAKQLGHADTRTVAQTYGHLSDCVRENEIRRNFPSMGPDHASLAGKMATDLATVWSAAHSNGQFANTTTEFRNTTPLQSSHRASAEVLDVFSEAEKYMT